MSVLLILHGLMMARALLEHGCLELFAPALHRWPPRQHFSDLTVSTVPITGWMFSDASKTQRNAWTLAGARWPVGTFSPLAHLLWDTFSSRKQARSSSKA